VTETRLRPRLTDAELRGRRIQDWFLHPAVWLAIAALAGMYLGLQLTPVGPRYSKLVIGVVFLILVFRFPVHIGAGLMLILYAFPARIWIGDTNFIFTVFVLLAWLVRITLRHEPRPRGTYLDWAILAYVAVQILSLVNVGNREILEKSLLALRHLFVPIVFYYVLVNVGRNERRLLFFAEMFTASMAFVFLTAFAERFFPHVRFLPQWMLTAFGSSDLFAAREVAEGRVGGLFSHAMLGDATAITFILQVYLATRYRHRWAARAYHWTMALLSIYVVSLTRNRGSLVLLMLGSAYFLFIFRREIKLRRVLAGGLIGIALLFFAEITLERFHGDVGLLGRLLQTHIERGIPDTRVGVWTGIWRMLLEKPILGHGPYFSLRAGALGLRVLYPHNTLLFYWFTSGLVGVIVFLVLVARVFRRTWVGHGLDIGRASLSRGLTAVFHIAAVMFMLGQMRTDHQRGDVFVFFMWLLFGFGVMARQIWEDRRLTEGTGDAEPAPRGAHAAGVR